MALDLLTQQLNLSPWLIVPIAIWIIVWKGLALWKSARSNQTIWFVVLLVVNTLGILEILYLFLFSQKQTKPTQNPEKVKKPKSKKSK